MPKLTRSPRSRYGLAGLSVLLVTLVMLLLDPVLTMTQSPFLLFLGAVLVSAWSGGCGPGLVVTALAGVICVYYFLPPLGSVSLDWASGSRLSLFLLEGVLISVFAGKLQVAQQQLERTLSQLQSSEGAYRQLAMQSQAQAKTLEAIFATFVDHVFVFDQEGRYSYVSASAAQVLGFSPEDMVGKTWQDLSLPAVIMERVDAQRALVMSTGRSLQSETAFFRDNEMRFYEYRLTPLRTDASRKAVVVIARDMTERKQAAAEREQRLQQEQTLRQQAEIAERKLDALLASIREDFLLFDHDWRVAYLNPQAELTMQRPRDQILGQRLWELFPDLVGTEYYQRLHQVMREQAPVQFEYHYETWDVWFDNRVYPSPEGITILCTNITKRKRAEAEREQLLQQEQSAREAAEHANRIKDEFLAVLSHELRSPLNPILGWSKLLQQGKLDAATTTTALTTIERNARLQVQLIDDLLDISRIVQGKLSLQVLPVDLSTVIAAALETVRLAAEAKMIQIDATTAPGVGMVLGDAGRLQQVVWNLLSNAVKFTPPGGHVTVALVAKEHQAQIQVRDTGKGIKPDFLPYVFEHFRQEDGATTRKFGGLGLGLAIVRQIVALHGGTVTVASLGAGAGATFTVQMPLAPRFAVLPASEPLSRATADLSGLHLLVVDDDADSREFVAFVLEQAGASVTAVASGMAALQAFSQAVPDMLMSDIGMPAMDGYLLLRQIRALPEGKQIPAVALTAYAGETNQQQAIAAGFQRHLAKPIDPEVVITLVTALVASA
ncbi:MAG: PAS domain-containing protein [Stenomitos frigidus ULC029]